MKFGGEGGGRLDFVTRWILHCSKKIRIFHLPRYGGPVIRE
jgi:hypothetical protein